MPSLSRLQARYVVQGQSVGPIQSRGSVWVKSDTGSQPYMMDHTHTLALALPAPKPCIREIGPPPCLHSPVQSGTHAMLFGPQGLEICGHGRNGSANCHCSLLPNFRTCGELYGQDDTAVRAGSGSWAGDWASLINMVKGLENKSYEERLNKRLGKVELNIKIWTLI